MAPPGVDVFLAAPAGYVSGREVLVVVDASDEVAVTRVELWVESERVGAVADSAYVFSWNSRTVDNGTQSLRGKAYDAAGNVGTSSPLIVEVANVAAVTFENQLSAAVMLEFEGADLERVILSPDGRHTVSDETVDVLRYQASASLPSGEEAEWEGVLDLTTGRDRTVVFEAP